MTARVSWYGQTKVHRCAEVAQHSLAVHKQHGSGPDERVSGKRSLRVNVVGEALEALPLQHTPRQAERFSLRTGEGAARQLGWKRRYSGHI